MANNYYTQSNGTKLTECLVQGNKLSRRNTTDEENLLRKILPVFVFPTLTFTHLHIIDCWKMQGTQNSNTRVHYL